MKGLVLRLPRSGGFASSFMGVLFVSLLSVVGSLLVHQTAAAWCDNLDIDSRTHDCVAQNYDSLPESVRNKVKFDSTSQGSSSLSFQDMIAGCMGGNAAGLDIAIKQGGCADAATSCLARAIDPNACAPDTLASIVGGINLKSEGGIWSQVPIVGPAVGTALGSDFNGCNNGKMTGDGSDDCAPLKAANQATIDALTKAMKSKVTATGSCTLPTTGGETAKNRAKEACWKAISDSCSPPELNDDGSLKNGVATDAYGTCLNMAILKTASDSNECKARTGGEGIWMDSDTKDPDGPNTLSKGCYKQATDLTNPEACEAGAKATGRDFKWQKTNKAGEKEAWGCVDPAHPNGVEADEGDASCPKDVSGNCALVYSVTGKCGAEAKTNIIKCNTTGGAATFNDILRIFVIVLSFGVGIAATGSIAYSAIRYAGARDNQSDVSLARERIRNVVIGLLLYGFLIAIANWLVPGGIF